MDLFKVTQHYSNQTIKTSKRGVFTDLRIKNIKTKN